SGSDIVKLYDLTRLCEEAEDDKYQNPFTLPIAVLLYNYVFPVSLDKEERCRHVLSYVLEAVDGSIKKDSDLPAADPNTPIPLKYEERGATAAAETVAETGITLLLCHRPGGASWISHHAPTFLHSGRAYI
ncbi:hypothetical protein CRUP_032185, partial [Coryphaenoides rupestris]